MSSLTQFFGGVVPLWISGTTYPLGYQVISPADLNVYIRKVAGAGTTDPKDDATNWKLLTLRPTRYVPEFKQSSSTVAIGDFQNTWGAVTSTSAGAPTTIVDVTGAGILNGVYAAVSHTAAGTGHLTLAIDGVEYTTSVAVNNSTGYAFLRECYSEYMDTSMQRKVSPIARIPFFKSLKITGYKTVAGMNHSIYHDYRLEL